MPAFAVQGHECTTAFGKKGLGQSQFDGPEGVAVNEVTGRVYVVDSGSNRIEFFSSAGVYEGEFNGSGTLPGEGGEAGFGKLPGEEETGRFSDPLSIAVDNSTSPSDPSRGDVYVVDIGHDDVVDKFTASGEYLTQVTGTPNKLFSVPLRETSVIGNHRTEDRQTVSVAVDAAGQLWVDFGDSPENFFARFSDEAKNIFVEERAVPGRFGELEAGLSIDSQGNLYIRGNFAVEDRFDSLDEKVSSTGELLSPEVGGGPTEWSAVESATGNVYLGQNEQISRYTAGGLLLERLAVGHLTAAGGIAVNSMTGTVYVADFTTDVVNVCPAESPKKATVEGTSVGEVTSEGATLSGEVNPRGAATGYHFEYGRCTILAVCPTSGYEASIPAPDGQLGASFEVSSLKVHLQNLSAGAVYHFRLVGHNVFGEANSVERVFITQSAGSALVLGDGRAWELVTPPDAHGAQLSPIAETGLLQASSTGGALAYMATNPVEPNDSQGLGEWAPVLSSRSTSGWSSTDVAVSHSAPIGAFVGFGQEYRFFSEDLSSAIVESVGPYSRPENEGLSEASPEPTERTPYLRHNSTCRETPATCYEPIVTGAEEVGDVPSSYKFGGNPENALGEAIFVGATPDVSHVIISSSVPLTEEFPAPHGGLYEWSETTKRLQLVSLLPESEGGEAATSFQFGGTRMERHAISDDGSRVFFTASASGKEHLYMRDVSNNETIRLDVPENGLVTTQSGVGYQTATAEGSKVFFTDRALLTKDSGSTGADLYQCEIVRVEEVGEKKLKCELSDLTKVPASGQSHAGEAAEAQGDVLGVSEVDGGYVYFVANGVQGEGASVGDCHGEVLTAGEECNLYVRHDGATSLIARLSSDDSPDWGAAGPLGGLTARVSPNGIWLTFMSDMPLTGYDNHDATSGRPDEEVYLYNAQTGRLVCVSCNPTNGRPAGKPYVELDKSEGGLVGGDRVWNENQWLAANIPGWTPYRLDRSLYQSRYLSDSGRLFFNSSDSLVPQDTNGNEDVYEYEPLGVGPENASCSTSSTTFTIPAGGCVGLISSGLGFGQSAFLDASTNGSDVFFLTAEKLVSQDTGTGLDIYDAHECTTAVPCPGAAPAASPECVSAAACRASPTSQPSIFGAPPSATFAGVGNLVSKPIKAVSKPKSLTRAEKLSKALKACKKEARERRGACERSARKRYGQKASSGKAKGKKGSKS